MGVIQSKRVVVLDDDPSNDLEEPDVEFRLVYRGILKGASKGDDSRARHKHEIRRVFHRQLRVLWETTPQLRDAQVPQREAGRRLPEFKQRRVEWLSKQFQRCEYKFVPLVTENLPLLCGISILFLRPGRPGALIKSGDIDNRIKTLFDAFRLPKDRDEFGGYDVPGPDEVPFFCLLEDDRLITKVSVETDMLLDRLEHDQPPDANEAHLIITVSLRYISACQV